MLNNPDYITARKLLTDVVGIMDSECVPLAACGGRILAEEIIAAENVPPFDRSPYDGYALRSEDTTDASRDRPVALRITEEVPAGAVPTKECVQNTAVKILTGAPIPKGADCVVMYEKTEFTDSTVKLFAPLKSGANIVRAGEDVRKGAVLAHRGQIIDAGTAGTLAAQGFAVSKVYRRPKVGILSTGSEVVEPGQPLVRGKIYNSNRYTLATALQSIGCESVWLGTAGDRVEDIAALISSGLEQCDAVLSTGGVSAGDYDLTPDAMEQAGIHVLLRGIDIKPGMACAYGEKNGKIFCGLSGNPASSLMNFHIIAAPALKKLAGRSDYLPRTFAVKLKDGFAKKSPHLRLLRGILDLSDGTVGMRMSGEQGNVVISSAIGCNVMAIVPAGSGPLEAGATLEGFLI